MISGRQLWQPDSSKFPPPRRPYARLHCECTHILTHTRLKIVGNDKQPLDLSHSGHLKVLDDAIAKWASGAVPFGDLAAFSIELNPYGTEYQNLA